MDSFNVFRFIEVWIEWKINDRSWFLSFHVEWVVGNTLHPRYLIIAHSKIRRLVDECRGFWLRQITSLQVIFDSCISFWPEFFWVLKLSDASDRKKYMLIHDAFLVLLYIFAVWVYVAPLLLCLLGHVLMTLFWVETYAFAKRNSRSFTRAVTWKWACMAAVMMWIKLMHWFTELLVYV